jgi:hypothetical protein
MFLSINNASYLTSLEIGYPQGKKRSPAFNNVSIKKAANIFP